MKITSKTLMVHFEETITVGYGTIEATLMGSAFIDSSNDVEIDFSDIINVTFMGMPIEKGYEGFKKFKTKMNELGVNVDEMFDTKFNELVTDEFKTKLKSMYHG